MTKIFLSLYFLGAVFLSPSNLKVVVKNIQVGKGSIVIEIYDNENNFFKKPVAAKRVKADNESLDFIFDIPEGVYAVAVYQDLNDNKILDKGIFNIPKEPYGLSNNYRPHFSAPHFNDCKFKVTEDTTMTITLK
jgi:uncharacterized protein (DUF2141 family)